MINKIKKYCSLDKKSLTLIIIILVVFFLYFWVQSLSFLTSSTDTFESNEYLPEILDGQEYVQQIHCEENGLAEIGLSLATFGRKNLSTAEVSLINENGEMIQSWDLNCSLLRDNTYYTLELNRRIKDSKGKTYFVKIVSDATENNGITIYCNNTIEQKGLFLNGEDLQKTLCYQLVYHHSALDLFSKANGFHSIVVIVLSCILILLIPALTKIKIHYAFLTMWILLGSIFLFSLPLFRVPDETNHFYRAYEVSCGHLISDTNDMGIGGRNLPFKDIDLGKLSNDWQTYSDNKEMELSDENTYMGFANISLYSPFSFIPQSIGIFLARHITRNVAAIAYSGRICNWLFITLLLFLAIQIIPVGKEIVALIALMPMNVQESVCLAPDGMVVAISILMVAVTVKQRYDYKDTLKLPQLLALYLLVFIVSQLKIVYLPFGLLYLLIPAERFGNQKKKILHVGSMGIIAVGANLIWLKSCSKFLTVRGTNANAQLTYILHNPLDYVSIMLRTYFENSGEWVNWMIGSSLGALNISPIFLLILLYMCVLFHKYVIHHRQYSQQESMENCLFGIVNFFIILLISTSLYMQWTAPYHNIIDGIQGRYFIALLLPLFFSLYNPRVMIEEGKEKNILSLNTISVIVIVGVCAGVSILFASLALGT